MKRLPALFLAFILTAALIPATFAEEIDAPSLSLSCASSLLMEKESGEILYQNNAHEKLEPASVTKIMTLLLVIESIDQGRIT